MVVNPKTGILTTIEDPLTTIIQHNRTAVFCAPEKHHSNIEINHNEMQHHFEVNILKLCEKLQCPLSFPRFAAIAEFIVIAKFQSTLSWYLLHMVRVGNDWTFLRFSH